ncbi:CMRF35-like molecule 1, partial [Larimichthys crocea]
VRVTRSLLQHLSLLVIFTMMKIYVYSCLLSALSVAEMKSLTVNGCVGNNVTFKCSNWNVWIDVKNNEKYFCNSPCSEEEHIIRAAFQKTGRKNRIEITNSADGLFVTFTNLQKSDSKKYYCGVNRLGLDPWIEVKLEVTDAESTTPRTTLKMLAVTNSSDFISDTSTSYIIYSTPAVDSTTTTTASSTQGA